jgi:hypothetical protein
MSPVLIMNVTGDDTIQEIELPLATSVAVSGRGEDIRIYGPDGVAYFTVPSGSTFIVDSTNLRGDTLSIWAATGHVIEIAIQQRR